MRERTIEQYLVRKVKGMGGLAIKLVSPSMAGLPDRLVLLPGGRLAFAELKAPGKKPTELQMAVHRILRNLGFAVYVVAQKEQVEAMLDEIHTPSIPADRR